MNKKTFKERAIELMQDGQTRSSGEIGTLLGSSNQKLVDAFLLNNQSIFEHDGNGWRLIPVKKRSKLDPLMQGM